MDIELLYYIQEHFRTESLTPFFKAVTFLGNSGWFWILLTAVLLVIKRTRRAGAASAVSLSFGFLITNVLLKNLIKRTRPYDAYAFIVPLIEHPSDYSFPSGHTCASFAAAFVLYRELPKKYSWIFLILAVLIAYSRLYLGVHYPTDVIGGFAVGLISAGLSELVIKKIRKNI